MPAGIVVTGLLYPDFCLDHPHGRRQTRDALPAAGCHRSGYHLRGLSLAGSAINNASTNWFLALVALAVIIIFNIWEKECSKSFRF